MLFTSEICVDCPKAHDYLKSIYQASEGKVSYTEVDIIKEQSLTEKYDIAYVPSIIVGDLKLEGLGEIREGLLPAILELSRGQS